MLQKKTDKWLESGTIEASKIFFARVKLNDLAEPPPRPHRRPFFDIVRQTENLTH